MRKALKRSFDEEAKEPVIERIFSLVDKYPSRNEAAKAWGINLNTLQNYYKRREQAPIPRLGLLQKIAECENVSIEWLRDGVGQSPIQRDANPQMNANEHNSTMQNIDHKLLALIGILSEEEKKSLFEVLARKGVETILYLLDEDNIKLLKLDYVVKEKILGKQSHGKEAENRNYEAAKECGGVRSEDITDESLNPKKKAV
ncbi:hypothetical protein [Enterobacter ludwigii]|uniref:hypothetical protein n=1 Tax=Enterobacter ludwigii TaxID=299767 RepID=UPI0013D08E70|nr:hypothetical protein [Enterobacter ludwigii]